MGLYGRNGPFVGYLTAEEIKRGMALASEALTAIEAEIERRAAGDVGSAADATAKVELHRVDALDVHGIGDTSLLETLVGAQAKADAARLLAQAYADAVVDGLIAAAPGALDTLNELAAALGDDPNFAATINAAIATRLTPVQGDARYRLAAALIGLADLGFDPATQGELDAAILTRASQAALDAETNARIAADNLRALLTDPRFADQRTPLDLSVTGAKVAAALKDAAAPVPSLRTLGTGALQAAAGSHVLRVLPGIWASAPYSAVSFFAFPIGQGRPLLIPWPGGSFDGLACEVTTGIAGGLVKMGVWADAGGYPGALLLDAGTVDASTAGVKVLTTAVTEAPPGFVWVVVVNQGSSAATIRFINGSTTHSQWNTSPTPTTVGHSTVLHNNLIAALPDPYPPGGLRFVNPIWAAIRKAP